MFKFVKEWLNSRFTFNKPFNPNNIQGVYSQPPVLDTVSNEDKAWAQCLDNDKAMYSCNKLELFGYAKKHKLNKQQQQVLLNLLYKGETRIRDYIDPNNEETFNFDLNKKIGELREKGFVIETVPLGIRKKVKLPCKFVYVSSPE